MKLLIKFFLCLAIALQLHYSMAQEARGFNPIPVVSALIKIKNRAVEFEVAGLERRSHGVVSLDIDEDTSAHIEIGDYNFDGQLDFSIWYLDEGKGTYTIHRVFIFSKKNITFKEVFSDCEGEFINLKIDGVKRRLISTYFLENVATQCVTKLPSEIN